MCSTPSTDIAYTDPTRTNPAAEIDDPTRRKLRNDIVLPNCTKSRTANDEPSRPTPNTEIDDASRPNERNAKELPICTKSKTDTDDANRANDRNDNELPRTTASTDDIEYKEPTRMSPRSEIEEPMRTKLRRAKELPTSIKSITDIFRVPERPAAQPNTDIDDPTRTKLLIDNELPTWRQSRVASDDPSRLNDRSASELPS
jgi:hypothetical protein